MIVTREVYEQMEAAARAAAPLEACGLLAGRDGTICRFYVLTNADQSAEHYSMKPEEQFLAIRDMRARKLDLLGIWHSHPATPARMSEEDLRLAYTPDAAYLILSLAGGRPDLRGFRMADGRAAEIELRIEKSVADARPAGDRPGAPQGATP